MLIKCPLDDKSRSLGFCIKCSGKCLHGNLPLHLARIPRERPVIKDQWSVTQLTSPLQITLLKQRNEIAIDPMDGVFATWGTAWHMMVEMAYTNLDDNVANFIIEKHMRVQVATTYGDVILTGIPDMYDTEQKILWDYKTTKAYSMGKAWESNEEWFWQLNLYRYWKFPEAEKMLICGAIRDYGWQTKERDGLDPITIREVPRYSDKDMLDYTVTRLSTLKRCQDEGLDPPECTDADRWQNWDRKKKKSVYMRCERYCPASDYCEQWKEELNENLPFSDEGAPSKGM